MAAQTTTGGAERQTGMTVGQISLREERSRTIKASERVAQEIVRDIVLRGLQTGDHLPLEAAMVDQYGVSRTSLREALRLLEVQGLISLKPGPAADPSSAPSSRPTWRARPPCTSTSAGRPTPTSCAPRC